MPIPVLIEVTCAAVSAVFTAKTFDSVPMMKAAAGALNPFAANKETSL